MIRHSEATGPQREFWGSPAKFRLFAGGVGSGKTRGGAIEALRMPAGSTGIVVAPTYPMLRDATLRTFLELVERAGILRNFHKQEMTAVLAGRRTILFRSGDNPDRLRGPNLGWFWIDEAAMTRVMVWKILIGRLREQPARGWATSTPRGKNWLWKELAAKASMDPRYKLVRAPSGSNPYLPADFIETLLDSYDPTFAAQEVGGEFLDDTLGQLIADWLVERLSTLVRPEKSGGARWLSCDLGEGSGRDSTAIFVGDALGILHGLESPWVGPAQAAAIIADLHRTWGVPQERIVYDAGGGRGLDIEPYLAQHRITEALPYRGSGSGGTKFANRRSKMGWRLRQRLDPDRPKPVPALWYDEEAQRIQQSAFYVPRPVPQVTLQDPFCLPADRPWWPRLAEELKALYYFHKGKQIALELKEDMIKRLGRSPNLVDALLMSRVFQGGDDDD